jgi:hypothetical protein
MRNPPRKHTPAQRSYPFYQKRKPTVQDALIIAALFTIGISIVNFRSSMRKIKQARKHWL